MGGDVTAVPDNASSDLKSRVQCYPDLRSGQDLGEKNGGRRSSFRQVLGILAVCLFGQHYEAIVEAEKCAFLVGMFGHVARLGCLNTGFESEVVKVAMPISLVNGKEHRKRYAAYTTVV